VASLLVRSGGIVRAGESVGDRYAGTEQSRRRRFLDAARRSGHVLGCHEGGQGQRFVDLLKQFRRFVPEFHPGQAAGDMLFFAATEAESVGIRWAAKMSPSVWEQHVSGRIHVHEVACAHTEMGNPTPIQEIGRKIELYLKAAQY